MTASDTYVLSALEEALSDRRDGSAAAAERLCRACVEVLDVDGAALSLMLSPPTYTTFAADSESSRAVDAIQFNVGQGPCYDSLATRRPVVVTDLQDPAETRFPAYVDAAVPYGIRAVYALPVKVQAGCIGVLDLLSCTPGFPSQSLLTAGARAATLAALPLLDLMGEVDSAALAGSRPAEDLQALGRIEVYQATGMLMHQLDVSVVEALARLRGHAFAAGRAVSAAAWDVLEGRLVLDGDDGRCP